MGAGRRLPRALPRTVRAHRGRRSRRWGRRAAIAGSVLLVLVAAIAASRLILTRRVEPLARSKLLAYLEDRYESEVELGRLEVVSVFPWIRAIGDDLVFRHHGRADVPPLITIRRLTVDAGPAGLLATPRRARRVRLEGLVIHVPPRREPTAGREARARKPPPAVLLGEVIADGAMLNILSRKPGKAPLVFDIHRLTLHSVGIDRPMAFRAVLTNAKPPGEIRSDGEFGPWQIEEPSLTPVEGRYTFERADLSVFRGLAGLLSSEGEYGGVLERIEVSGHTDTPDFAVRAGGQPVHLTTEFDAVVDGTDGDVLLQPVVARFLSSRIVARGGVVGRPGAKGKAVVLDVTVEEARVEDLLRLAIGPGRPPLFGDVAFRTKFELPPGKQEVMLRLNLDGVFGIRDAEFTSPTVKKKVAKMSRRARGRTEGGGSDGTDDIVSDLRGRFVLDNGLASFSDLTFEVPGAQVRLDGSYGLDDEKLDFRGTLRLEAKLSETTTGIRSFLLKAVDPLFEKDGAGTQLPIEITGTRREPSFGLDLLQRRKRGR